MIIGGAKVKTIDDYVRCIPDFPEPGIMFRDITTVIGDPDGFKLAVDELQNKLEGLDFDVIVGLESRGFIFGAPLAYKNDKGMALVRKKGKLPCETISTTYELEYGSATVEIHKDAIKKGQKVVIVDDLMATGGTVAAAIKLVEELGGEVVMVLCLLELSGLNGRAALKGYNVETVLAYDGK